MTVTPQLKDYCGLDIEMASSSYLRCLSEETKKNPELLKLIDEAVLRVLKLKEKAGLLKTLIRRKIYH